MKRSHSNEENANGESMREISHTNPYTGEIAGRLFSRGPTVVADGGERTDGSRTSGDRRSSGRKPAATDPNRRTEEETMKDVSHTPPNGAEDANEVFERGHEHGRKRERERGASDV